MFRNALIAGGILLLVAAFGVGIYVDSSNRAGTPAATAAPATDASALTRFHSPTIGEAEAKVHIVEFFDPACGTCRDFYPFVKRLMAENPGKIRLTLRYAAFHKGSDQVVKLLEAARKQGKLWPAIEALLATQDQWTVQHVARVDLALPLVARVGLNAEQLKQDMQIPALDELVRQDLKDAVTLNVTQTPEFFVNGRPLPSFGYEQLKTLVEQALRENYG
jgi:protein-disulfide isomerase